MRIVSISLYAVSALDLGLILYQCSNKTPGGVCQASCANLKVLGVWNILLHLPALLHKGVLNIYLYDKVMR